MKLSVRLGKLVDGRTRSHALAGSGQEQLKSGHVRTVPVPERVFCELSMWIEAAGIQSGKVFRRVSSAASLGETGPPRSSPGTSSRNSPQRWEWRTARPTTFAEHALACVGRPEAIGIEPAS